MCINRKNYSIQLFSSISSTKFHHNVMMFKRKWKKKLCENFKQNAGIQNVKILHLHKSPTKLEFFLFQFYFFPVQS